MSFTSKAWLPVVMTSTPSSSNQDSAMRAVMPWPWAAFSPLTTTKSTASSRREVGQVRLHEPPARFPHHIAKDQYPHAIRVAGRNPAASLAASEERRACRTCPWTSPVSLFPEASIPHASPDPPSCQSVPGRRRCSPRRPAFMPLADIRPGMKGQGRTVFQGGKIERFDFEVLGVFRNGGGPLSAPGRSLILVKASGGPLADTGIIAGMSGSPCYIDGKLVGALAIGFPFEKEPIGGITPIGEMIEQLQDLPDAPAVRTPADPAEAGTPHRAEVRPAGPDDPGCRSSWASSRPRPAAGSRCPCPCSGREPPSEVQGALGRPALPLHGPPAWLRAPGARPVPWSPGGWWPSAWCAAISTWARGAPSPTYPGNGCSCSGTSC